MREVSDRGVTGFGTEYALCVFCQPRTRRVYPLPTIFWSEGTLTEYFYIAVLILLLKVGVTWPKQLIMAIKLANYFNDVMYPHVKLPNQINLL